MLLSRILQEVVEQRRIVPNGLLLADVAGFGEKVRLVTALLLAFMMFIATNAMAQEAAVSVSSDQMPNGYLLESAYPNPFNPSATVGFAVLSTQEVELGLYNALGRKVRSQKYPARRAPASPARHVFTIQRSRR